MMRAEYKRDMNHNYLILKEEESLDTSSYQVRMMVGNSIPSLLKCRVQGIDGQFMVYYDITSKQSVAALFEEKKLGYTDLQLLFSGFIQVMEEMAEFLLNPGQLVIRPEYMYVDLEKRQLYFCYLPGFQEDVRKQFQELTEYILPKLNHEDQDAVMLGYGVYRRALEDVFHLEYIKEELYRDRKEAASLERPEKAFQEELWGKENIYKEDKPALGVREDLWNEADNGKKALKITGRRKVGENQPQPAGEKEAWEGKAADKENSLNKYCEPKREKSGEIGTKIAGCLAAASVILAVIAAKVLGYLPQVPLEALLGGILAIIGIGMLSYLLFSRRKKTISNRAKEAERRDKRQDRNVVRETADQRKSVQSENIWREDADSENLYKRNLRDEDCQEESLQGYGSLEEIQKKDVWGAGNWDKTGWNDTEEENFGETEVLSANVDAGPACLVSREPGELAPIYLERDLTVIGKLANAADAVVNLPSVSRIHAKIRRRDGEYYLTDLNSRNGTSVNGQMLKGDEDYCLQNEDEVDFAQARYVFIK